MKQFESDLSPDCSLWIEIDLSLNVIEYFMRHDITLDYMFLWSEELDSVNNCTIYTNYWNIVENLDYVY